MKFLLMALPRGVRMPFLTTYRASSVAEPISRNRAKIHRTFRASSSSITSFHILRLVAVGRCAAHEDALHPAGLDLVADALRRHLAFELGERQQDVEGEPSHRSGGVEALGDGDEGDIVPVEYLDQLGEVHERARQAVYLVDHHHVNQAVLDIREEPLQGRAVQRAAGDAAVVIVIAHQRPALRALTGDVGLASLALGVETIELLLEAFLG
jgi:hypothetical protein